jgi:hypothetical protein
MSKVKQEYFKALERLKNRAPEIIAQGYKINNDTVALEAGRKRGSIKPTRMPDVIAAIELVANDFNPKEVSSLKKKQAQVISIKKEKDDYKVKYQKSLNRELNLMIELEKIKGELIKIKSKVIPIKQ